MPLKVFYSWQSDLPNSTNRGFIQKALESAAAEVNKDDSVSVETVIDRDTNGVGGSPNIIQTILGKIDDCDLFVADVSIINVNDKSRHTPNPNVLIELGYAVKNLGFGRVVLLMNEAFGSKDELPFDLPKHRVVAYTAQESDINKAEEKKRIKAVFIDALKFTIEEYSDQKKTTIVPKWKQAYESILRKQPQSPILIQEYIKDLITTIDSMSPKYQIHDNDQNSIPVLIDAIKQKCLNDLLVNYCRVCEALATICEKSYCIRLLQSLSGILTFYNLRRDSGGSVGINKTRTFDYYKFLGHQLLVIFYAYLFRERQYLLAASLLKEKFKISNPTHFSVSSVDYRYFSYQTNLLLGRRDDIRNTPTQHSFLLYELYGADKGLGAQLEFALFADADSLLLLRSVLQSSNEKSIYEWNGWGAWGYWKVENTLPMSLANLKDKEFAGDLLGVLGVAAIDSLSAKLTFYCDNTNTRNYEQSDLISAIAIGKIGT